MGSLTACWKLCFNMPGWVWKKISFLISINPALTHGSEVAPENAAHPSERRETLLLIYTSSSCRAAV